MLCARASSCGVAHAAADPPASCSRGPSIASMWEDAASARSSSIDIICVDSCALASSNGAAGSGRVFAASAALPVGALAAAVPGGCDADAPPVAAFAWSRKICVVSDGSSSARGCRRGGGCWGGGGIDMMRTSYDE